MEIKEARKRARYSQEAAAERLGVSRPTYARMEQNPASIRMGMAQKIADLFEVSIGELIFLDSDDN